MRYLFTLLFINLCFAQTYLTEATDFQLELNKSYADSSHSPLQKKDLKDFDGLDFYPISEEYYVKARFEKLENSLPFEMKTSTERLPKFRIYAILYFTLNDVECQLNVYQSVNFGDKNSFDDYLFLPFSDLTSGDETYIGGRYLDMKIPEEGATHVFINFNKAYNPYCAYNYKYSCPLVPLENDLKVAIKAGVKKFHD